MSDTVLSVLIPVLASALTGAATWLATRRQKRNDFIASLQHSIDSLAASYDDLKSNSLSMKTSYCVMKSIVLIAVSALCGCRSPSPVPVVAVTERVRSIPVKDSLSLTALIRVDTLKRIVLSEVQASATPNMRYRLSLDTLPDASRLRLDVYNVRDSVRLIERDSVVFVPVQQAEAGKPDDYRFLFFLIPVAVVLFVLLKKT